MIDQILDRWSDGSTAYQIGVDLSLAESTVKRVVEVARCQRDNRAGLHRYPNGRFYGSRRSTARAISLWPQIRIITIPWGQNLNRQRAVIASVVSRQAARARGELA